MPASNKKLYFIHIPKTAGTFVNTFLKEALGERFVREGHCVNTDIYPWFRRAWGEKCFQNVKREDCVVFSIVRNPFDLLVSMYSFGFPYWPPSLAAENVPFDWPFLSFKDFIYKLCKWDDYPWIYPPQKKSLFFQLFDREGNCVPDFILRQEELMEGLQELLSEIGVEKTVPKERINSSESRKEAPYAAFYDAELKELVENKFRNDLRVFGYNFDGHDGRTLFSLDGVSYSHEWGEYSGNVEERIPPVSDTRPQGSMENVNLHALKSDFLEKFPARLLIGEVGRRLKRKACASLPFWKAE